MQLSKKIDLTNDTQKIIAGVVLFIVLAIVWMALPSLVWFFENLIWLGVLVITTLFIILQRNNIWDGMKQLTWETTKKMISSNKLWYMYRYYDPYLLTKIAGMEEVLTRIMAVQNKQTKRGLELKASMDQNSALAIKAEERGDSENVIRSLRNKVNIDKQQLDAIGPKIVNTDNQIKLFTQLIDVWKADAVDLKYSLDATASAYELSKELSDASGAAKAFLGGDTSEEYKTYVESIKQIEDSMAQYAANFENFERQAKPVLENLALSRAVSEDAGAKLIEEFRKGSTSLNIVDHPKTEQ